MPIHASIRTGFVSLWLLCAAALPVFALPTTSYFSACPGAGWEATFRTFGLSSAASPEQAQVVVACENAEPGFVSQEWLRSGGLLVLQGPSPLAAEFGFVPSQQPEREVRAVRDLRSPDLMIVWEHPERVNPVQLPPGARVLAEERRQHTPLLVLLPVESGFVLYSAMSPGENGYERFPFLGNALLEAGFVPPFRGHKLWAFLDTAYRQRVDLDFAANRWREFGIAGLQVSAWQHWERDEQKDRWLRSLIDACHRHGILVYAWFEFPHVSDRFWEAYPECREKTALGQDAQLDWRKLINLQDPSCAMRMHDGAASLLSAFGWDGVNLAEIYFESLEGAGNPARFTPMNAAARKAFGDTHGFDPADLFDASSPRHQSRNPDGLALFLEWRRQEIGRLHEEWLRFAENAARDRKDLDIVVTQIDDRFDHSVRDSLGVDTEQLLGMMHRHPFTLLVEDPATIWNLGPSRYTAIAEAYAKATPYPDRLAVDINIFPRYQDVYPTRQQTGMELYRLVHQASQVFPRVALYAEHVLTDEDLPLLAAAAWSQASIRRRENALIVESAAPTGIRWSGPARVNGRVWAGRNQETLWLPAGRHLVEPADEDPLLQLLQITGDLRQLRSGGRHLELHYTSRSRAIAIFNELPQRVWIDGEQLSLPVYAAAQGFYLHLPAGEHLVRLEAATGELPSQ